MGLLSSIGGIAGAYFGGPIGSIAGSTIGGMLESSGERSAASQYADAQSAAAQQAAAASAFRPVGITTRFGTSNFTVDPNTGKLTGAGYTLTPEMKAQQDALMGVSGQALQQYKGGFGAAQPLGTAAQGLMGLGQGYLATTPQEQAAKYMQEQQALLAPSRAAQLSALQNTQFQQGRTGLALGGSDGMLPTNPEMAAYYNSIAQQNAQLAAQSTQGGMDYAKFGAGLLGTGGQMLGQQYGLQSQAFTPYQTALSGAQTIEGLGQQPLDIGVAVGAQGKGSINQSLLQQGLNQAAATRAQAGDPWTGLLAGAGQAVQPYLPQIQQQMSNWLNPGVNLGTATGADWNVASQW